MNFAHRHVASRYVAGAAALLLLGAAALAGCDFTEGNDRDPNSATDAPAPLVLTATEVANILLQEGNFARLSGIFTNQMTGGERQYSGFEVYNATSSDFGAMWDLAYADVLPQAKIVIAKSTQQNNRVLRGIARAHMGWGFGTLAALFGDVPYEEALRPEEFPDPQFTDQATVYAAVQDTLSAALADLESGVGDAPADIYFSGDPDSWQEVVHTLSARFYLHVGDYENALAQAQEGISSPEGNLVAPHGSSANSDRNVYFEFIQERGGYLIAEGAYAARLLDPDSDVTRADDLTDDSNRFNFHYADTDNNGELDLNTNDGQFAGRSSDFTFLTYSENQLILAEALLQTGGDASAALEALNNVRTRLNAQYGESYELYEMGDFGSDSELLSEILEEKYLLLIGQIEAFNDLRRTENFIGVPPKTGNVIPQRFLYPQSEITANENAPPVSGLFEVTPVNEALSYDGL